MRKPNKYRNIKTGTHDSRKEKKRGADLALLERAGKIAELRSKVKYVLIPAQYIDGKCVERACTYTADYVYRENGEEVVEDVKGFPNDRWAMKRKLMLHVHGIRVRET